MTEYFVETRKNGVFAAITEFTNRRIAEHYARAQQREGFTTLFGDGERPKTFVAVDGVTYEAMRVPTRAAERWALHRAADNRVLRGSQGELLVLGLTGVRCVLVRDNYTPWLAADVVDTP